MCIHFFRTGILEKNKPRCWMVATVVVEVVSSYRAGKTGNYLSCKYQDTYLVVVEWIEVVER